MGKTFTGRWHKNLKKKYKLELKYLQVFFYLWIINGLFCIYGNICTSFQSKNLKKYYHNQQIRYDLEDLDDLRSYQPFDSLGRILQFHDSTLGNAFITLFVKCFLCVSLSFFVSLSLFVSLSHSLCLSLSPKVSLLRRIYERFHPCLLIFAHSNIVYYNIKIVSQNIAFIWQIKFITKN